MEKVKTKVDQLVEQLDTKPVYNYTSSSANFKWINQKQLQKLILDMPNYEKEIKN